MHSTSSPEKAVRNWASGAIVKRNFQEIDRNWQDRIQADQIKNELFLAGLRLKEVSPDISLEMGS